MWRLWVAEDSNNVILLWGFGSWSISLTSGGTGGKDQPHMWSVIYTWQSTNKNSGHPASGEHFWFALIPAYCLPHVVAKSQHSMTAGRGKLGALYLENSWTLPRGSLPLVNFNLYACCNRLCCCFSVAKLCLTLCDPMHCSRPGSSVLHYLPEFAQIHVHWTGDAVNHLILCCPLLLFPSVFPRFRAFSSELALHIR